MSGFSYNISEKLEKILITIDRHRTVILTTPISPRNELKLRFEAQIDRLYAIFKFGEVEIPKSEIIKLLSGKRDKKISGAGQQILDFKSGFDAINCDWQVSDRNVSLRTVENLFATVNRRLRFTANRDEIKNLLDFLQSSKEHPVVLSGIAAFQYEAIGSGGFAEGKIARLLSYLYLNKSGYDFRGLLKIEEGFLADRDNFREIFSQTLKSRNLTMFLEYFAKGISEQLAEAEKDAAEVRLHLNIPAGNFDINDRQKEILVLFEQPDMSLTNRKVQKLFSVSQITASRDLAGLATLGLIFAYGKGRSVHYTKA